MQAGSSLRVLSLGHGLRQLPSSGSLTESSAGAGMSPEWLVSSGGPIESLAAAVPWRPPPWSLSMELLGHLMTLDGSQGGALQDDKRLQAWAAPHLPVPHWSQLVTAQSHVRGAVTV